MSESNLTNLIPSSGWVNLADLDRMAKLAAEHAVQGVVLKQGDVEKMIKEGVSQGLERFMERSGIENLSDFRKDLSWAGEARKLRESLVRQGFLAGIGLIVAAVGTAIWVAIKTARLP